MKDQTLGHLNAAGREENNTVNLAVNAGRQLPGSEAAVRTLNNLDSCPVPARTSQTCCYPT